jgi:hypothetical protein
MYDPETKKIEIDRLPQTPGMSGHKSVEINEIMSGHKAFEINGIMYLIGGARGDNLESARYIYDPETHDLIDGGPSIDRSAQARETTAAGTAIVSSVLGGNLSRAMSLARKWLNNSR